MIVTCFWMPSVMSTWLRMQFTHMLVGLGAMATPHMQHSLEVQGMGGDRREAAATAARGPDRTLSSSLLRRNKGHSQYMHVADSWDAHTWPAVCGCV
jgi:hypothetical protein